MKRAFPRILAATGLGMAAIAAAPLAASAASGPVAVTAAHDPAQDPAAIGFGQVFGPDTAGAVASFVGVEGNDYVRVYCIQYGVDFPTWDPLDPPNPLPDANFTATGWDTLRAGPASGSDTAALSKAKWLVAHQTYNADGSLSGEAIGTPIAAGGSFTEDQLPDAEASATQLAIWSIVNGTDISGVVNAELLTRAQELVSLANEQANPPAEGPYAFSATLTTQDLGDPAKSQLVATAWGKSSLTPADPGQEAQAGVDVLISVPADSGIDLDPETDGQQTEFVGVTDVNGQVSTPEFATTTADVTATAAGSFIVPLGTILTPSETSQQALTADEATVERSATSVIPAASTPSPTTPTPTTPTPTIPSDNGGELPWTGGWLTPAAAFAAAGAGGLGLWLRRRGQGAPTV